MNVIVLLREQLAQAHELMQATMADVTPEQVHWIPPGTANPLGATYVHALAGEDATIHMILQGGTPLYAGEWADKTGVSEIQPLSTPDWARRVRIDLPTLRRYAEAVYEVSDAYLSTLSDHELARIVDLSNFGMGEVTVGYILNRFLVGHVDNMCGEISCLKGLQGGRGYPM